MFEGPIVLALAFLYAGMLFAVAWYGDLHLKASAPPGGRPLIYALSIGVYCTTWTFYGSVGNAARTGFDFIPVYLGPILMFCVCWPLLLRVIRLAKAQNITSIADFLAARYGKSPAVAAVVTIVAVIGMLPYVALQLKAVLITTDTLLSATVRDLAQTGVAFSSDDARYAASGLIVAGLLALFAILFGTRHIDATEHQDGMTVAIAAESLLKLTAFVAVGLYVVFFAFGGLGPFLAEVRAHPEVQRVFSQAPSGGSWLTVTFLAFVCALLLPRQFHMTVVENRSDFELKRAAWLFPAYLIAINLFVVPLAMAGLVLFGPNAVDPDRFVLLVPLAQGAEAITMLVFVGGVSAATAMVIVEAVALSIMVCNGLIMPLLLRHRAPELDARGELGPMLLFLRRVVIVLIVLLGYLVERALAGAAGLTAIGLISFAAIAQLAPAFFLGLFWRGGTARGAIAGILSGAGVWAYTLLLPWVVTAGWLPETLLTDGPLGIAFLKPQALFYLSFDPVSHGVFWSLTVNTAVFVYVSLSRQPEPVERLQSQFFVHDVVPPTHDDPSFRLWRSSLTVGDLKAAVGRYLGPERATASFATFAASRGMAQRDDMPADPQCLRFAEHLLTSAIGAASSRLVLSLLLRRRNIEGKTALRLLDDASEALQYNRDLLQSAIDQVKQGLVVFDRDMRLTCWNRQFVDLLALPPDLAQINVPLDRILAFLAERGDLGEGVASDLVADRLDRMVVSRETLHERLLDTKRHIEIRTAPMPQGGIVATFADITERVEVSNALARVNLTLERRVEERTAELLSLNTALAIAKSRADEASQDKTRFIAAASHDILQPLNAARLYATSMVERDLPGDVARIADNLDSSLKAVEEIFGAIIEISRIDAGRADPQLGPIAVNDLLENLKVEFAPSATECGLELRFVGTSLWVNSDRRMLRRLLQNLLSNAIKYTDRGRVVVGVRRSGRSVVIVVADSGPGIPQDQQQLIFREFQRLHADRSGPRGLGLGLSIVDRLSGVLGARVAVRSQVGRGSMFMVSLPMADPAATPLRQSEPKRALGRLEGALVLCIDNEPAVLEGMETLLRNWGCDVIAAHDQESAVNGFKSADRVPDVVFADYHLDETTGLNVIAELRAMSAQDLPAAIITADHTELTEGEVRQAGVTLLRKPIKAGAVRAMVARYARRTLRDAAE